MPIVKHYVPALNNFKVTPCFIRSQLGPVFSQISHRLMRGALTELEILSQSRDVSKFPMIVSTFSVLLMAMESLQYHFCKIPYHTHHDNPGQIKEQERDPKTRNLDELHGADVLLRFYKATNCHALIGKICSESALPAAVTTLEADPTGFLSDLKASVMQSESYLRVRLDTLIVPRADMGSIFDRLLAKMYLMEK
jgi:hypothetical protein